MKKQAHFEWEAGIWQGTAISRWSGMPWSHGYWQDHHQPRKHRISHLTGEQTVLPVADRPNVSESERDGFSDKHPKLAQPQFRLRFWDEQQKHQHRADGVGSGWHRQAKSHGQDLDRA